MKKKKRRTDGHYENAWNERGAYREKSLMEMMLPTD